jgi:hypothetical protein|nr:MAG TPA: hypothetical protein [Caudoviricetes sp.]
MSEIFKSWKKLQYSYPDFIDIGLLNKDKERDIYNKLFKNGDIILWDSDVGWKSFVITEINNLERAMRIEHYPLYHRHSRDYFFKNIIDIKNMLRLKERY